jgi:ketosteroid isomerase-like protein
MSQENVEIVRRGFAASERGDLTAAFEYADPDMITRRPQLDDRIFRGPEGFLQAFIDWVEDFEEFSVTLEELIDANPSQVLARVHQHAVGTQSGVPVDADFWFVYTFGGGKCVRLEMYVDRDRAREAAGLRE